MPIDRKLTLFWPAALLGLAFIFLTASHSFAQVRIKDIASFEGIRKNQLVGYGLVVGLNGTGDRIRNSPFTKKSIEGMLERLGVGNLSNDNLKTKNTAAVMVTAMLPPFAKTGSTIDVVLSSLGDATSLRGGTLIVTPLTGADGEIYAVAQGPIAVAGFVAQGINASIVQGVPTVARIENGAIVENEVKFVLSSLKSVMLSMRTPDSTTVTRVKEAINKALGPNVAVALDPSTVEVHPPGKMAIIDLMAAIENLRVVPDNIAKVIIDARSGTIVIGANVRIDRVAISQGGLTILVEDTLTVSQPEPFSIGETVVIPETKVVVENRPTKFTVLEGDVSLQRLVDGLNAIGVGATETISILQAIKAAGALHAYLEII